MKKRLFIIAVIAMTFTLASYAQENNAPENSPYRKDLGFNTSFILNGVFQLQSTPFSIMYKMYGAENKALRLGLDANIQSSKSDGEVINGSYTNSSSVVISLSVGKEFQQHLGEKWIWYYGVDVAPSFTQSHSEYIEHDEQRQSFKTSSYGIAARPFLGIRFAINSRLYLAAEASARLSYNKSSQLNKSYNPDQTLRDITSNNFDFSLNPASGIFIFYRF